MADNQNYVYDVYDNLSKIATGIFLNIDNNLLSACQKAVQSKVLEVCGSLSECDAFDDDNVIGTDSLVPIRDKDKIIIDGLMNFGLLGSKATTDNQTGKVTYSIDDTGYKFDDDIWDNADQATLLRIKSAIKTIETRVTQQIDALSTDPTIRECIFGKGNDWRYGKSKGKGLDDSGENVQRFSHLLDSYSKMIFNSGLKKAYLNYRTKYDEMVAKALEDQSDDIKGALCSAMASDAKPVCLSYKETDNGEAVCGEWTNNTELMSIFDNGTGETGLQKAGTQYVLQVADLNKKLQAMSTGKGEFIQTDGDGNMIGSISMISSYSPSSNTCKIKTTSVLCKNAQAIYDTITESCDSGGGIVNVSAKCNGFSITVLGDSGGKTVTTKEFKGTKCTEYGDPKIDDNEIKM